MKPLALVTALAASQLLLAEGMNHIDPIGLDLVSTPGGRIQVFTDTPDASRMIIDDFLADGPIITGASMTFEFPAQDIDRPDGWRISVWDSISAAETSGNDFTGNVLDTVRVDFFDGNWSLGPIAGTGADTQAYRIDFINLNLNIGTGVRYIGIAPIQSSNIQLNWSLLDHDNPSVLGNGTANDSIGINPSGGLGLGTSYSMGTNASYQVELVPEPATMLVLGAAAVAMLKRRRRA